MKLAEINIQFEAKRALGKNRRPKEQMYALFKNGRQISKAHFINPTVWIEALERHMVFECRYGQFLPNNYEIKEI